MKPDSSERLLQWYRRRRRDLPWRRGQAPYVVLVSEIMLQQTRVETVIPYFERFLETFPTIEHLAGATQDEVLARWSGLGYYRRARLLHAAAREIVARGRFPERASELIELPGIGPYTAAAVASIAFGEAVAVVDGNVERVASRMLALAGDPARGAAKAEVRTWACSMLDECCPGDSNQALMELGAVVCRPATLDCEVCPLSDDCQGLAMGVAEQFPHRAQRASTVLERRVVAIVENDGRFLLYRNPDDAVLLAGMWELPWVVRRGRLRRDWEAALSTTFGGRWTLGERVGEARHAITTRRIVLGIHRAQLEHEPSAVSEGPEAGWFSPGEIANVPTPSMVHKVLDRLGRADQSVLH
ncbi:MAG: A/G-specific adenine glycosylase [Acidobacteriota bacterium]|nr:A/G-specific adenine glycosylase [Acidobacteriota bacterium]